MSKKLFIAIASLTLMTSIPSFADTCSAPTSGEGFFRVVIIKKTIDSSREGVKCEYYATDSDQFDRSYFLDGSYTPVSGEWLNDYPIYQCFDAKSCEFKKLN